MKGDRQGRRGGARRGALVAVVVVAAGVGAAFLAHAFDPRGGRELAAAEAAAVAAGLPINCKDAVFARHANESLLAVNAARTYEEAFDVISGLPSQTKNADLPVEGRGALPEDGRTPLPPKMLGAVRAYVSERAGALELMHEAADMSPCVFPISWDGFRTPLPHVRRARDAARLVTLAVILDAEEGRGSAAVSATLDNLALARALSDEPTVVSGLVAMAIDSHTIGGAQRLVSRADVNTEDLATLQREFEARAEGLTIRAGLAGNGAMLSDAIVEVGKGVPSGDSLGASNSGTDADDDFRLSVPARWYYRSDVKGARAEGLRMAMTLVAIADKPAARVLRPAYINVLDSQVAGSRYHLSDLVRIMVPGQFRAIEQCEVTRARYRCAAACMAASRYYRERGAWPESLDGLVPEYLGEVPLDPFTDAPLVYRVREDGIMVYTVGVNGVDDGGKKSLVKPAEGDRGSYDDFGFRVWK